MFYCLRIIRLEICLNSQNNVISFVKHNQSNYDEYFIWATHAFLYGSTRWWTTLENKNTKRCIQFYFYFQLKGYCTSIHRIWKRSFFISQSVFISFEYIFFFGFKPRCKSFNPYDLNTIQTVDVNLHLLNIKQSFFV